MPKLDKDYSDEELNDENIDETDEIKTTLDELGNKYSGFIPSDKQLIQLMKPDVNIIKFDEWDKIFSPDFGLVLESGNYQIYTIL
ncbi:hypothetical protein PIROE2DRAFT_7283 [Piromyces sp. E2]|nr:hypothetical protein PIROE2DRAFT_7283 [Piromyces sp. E2]|eukprot:OUM65696.1 hypothetical protein PIROE2DRAFT_7283 [Piromyces sp. E2]